MKSSERVNAHCRSVYACARRIGFSVKTASAMRNWSTRHIMRYLCLNLFTKRR